MSGLHHAADLLLDFAPTATSNLRDVDDHIQLLAAILNGTFCLDEFGRRRMPPVRKTDGGAGQHGAALQDFRTTGRVVRHDADAGDIKL